MKRILQLDNQLANQIAAGEVVERPASVVKELIENSVDAGATRIAIDIERGGARLIRIVDDGYGIHPDDLPLALSRHATSKIRQFSELCAVQTLGFRGEALASIASVAKLLLRSRLKDQEQGWQATAEGRDMAVSVTPAAATEGTCVEVRDLFYNTPARRKFLRTEKTEFAHIEDVVKREALATPEVSFVLKNNGTVVKRYPAAKESHLMQQKLVAVCGQRFVKQAIQFRGEIDDLKVYGWLGLPEYHRSESDLQLLFVNGRPVKDRMLSHAVRQSYADRLPTGRFATYVIYVECDPNQVDVNVHPTKHEVKFTSPRQLHDFLVKLLDESLQQGHLTQENWLQEADQQTGDTELPKASSMGSEEVNSALLERRNESYSNTYSSSPSTAKPSKTEIAEHQRLYSLLSDDDFSKSDISTDKDRLTKDTPKTTGIRDTAVAKKDSEPDSDPHGGIDNSHTSQPIFLGADSLWKNRYLVFPEDERLWLIDCWRWVVNAVEQQWLAGSAHSKAILIPKGLTINNVELFEDATVFDRLLDLGIELTPSSESQVLLRKLPDLNIPISEQAWLAALQNSLLQANKEFEKAESLRQLIVKNLLESSSSNQKQILNWCKPQLAALAHSKEQAVHWQKFAWPISVTELSQRIEKNVTRR